MEEEEPLTEGEGDDLEAVNAIRELVDTERGYPRQGKRIDGRPLAEGDGMVLHAFEIEPVAIGVDGLPSRWATKLPEKAETKIPAEVLAKITKRKRSEIDAMKKAMADAQGEDEG